MYLAYPKDPTRLWAPTTVVVLSLLSLVALACSEDEPTEPPPPPADLELSDLLGVWHCVECRDLVKLTEVASEDSTLFMSILPDSIMVYSCRRDSLRWEDFYSTPDTMSIAARGFLTNQADAVFTWTKIDSLDAHKMVITVFGNQVVEEIRRKIPQEPACPAGP